MQVIRGQALREREHMGKIQPHTRTCGTRVQYSFAWALKRARWKRGVADLNCWAQPGFFECNTTCARERKDDGVQPLRRECACVFTLSKRRQSVAADWPNIGAVPAAVYQLGWPPVRHVPPRARMHYVWFHSALNGIYYGRCCICITNDIPGRRIYIFISACVVNSCHSFIVCRSCHQPSQRTWYHLTGNNDNGYECRRCDSRDSWHRRNLEPNQALSASEMIESLLPPSIYYMALLYNLKYSTINHAENAGNKLVENI